MPELSRPFRLEEIIPLVAELCKAQERSFGCVRRPESLQQKRILLYFMDRLKAGEPAGKAFAEAFRDAGETGRESVHADAAVRSRAVNGTTRPRRSKSRG